MAGVDIRGSATGTVEIATCSSPGHVDPTVHGIVLAGGSAFGLEAASGVRRYLGSERASGVDTGRRTCPDCAGARFCSISASARANVRPTRAMGEAAAAAATDASGEGRLRRRGHRRDRRQDFRHAAGHEGRHRIGHRGIRRRQGLEPGSAECIRRHSRSRIRKAHCWRPQSAQG